MANAYAAVSVGTSATKILSLSNFRMGCSIANNGSQTLYIGMDSSVTTSNGFPIPAANYFLNSGYVDMWRGDIWGIVAATTCDVRYWTWDNR